jgi:beta-apo-4'-carotenal oxygenase
LGEFSHAFGLGRALSANQNSAYNFPVQLALGPFIGAIAAGNTGILKPSEVASHTAAVLESIVTKALDPTAYGVVQGAIPETTSLLDQKWDKIFYTGNTAVGTIIAKKAAETLTPVVLELGGMNPAIVARNADPRLAARRLIWGKTHNAGQICLSENYILIDKDVYPTFLVEWKAAMQEFYPQGQKASADYGRIVNDRHFERIKGLLDNTKGEIITGGQTDAKDRFIETTLVKVDSIEDPIMKTEIFGPLLPVMLVDNLDEAIAISRKISDTSLAIYPFGDSAETGKVLSMTRSGGASVNDAFFHGAIPTLAFGGVGNSGQGAYRGKSSFDAFTHRRSVTTTPGWIEMLIKARYPPYTASNLKMLQTSQGLKPNFGRDGKVKVGLLSYVLSLGGGSTKAVLVKYLLAIFAAVGVRAFLEGRKAKL